VNPQSGEPGDTVTYTYVVTNTGDTTLFHISVDDDVMGHIGDIDQLDPKESATLTADFQLPDQQGDLPLVNVGTATGTDVLGGSVSDDDNAGVTILRAENPPTPPPPTAFTGSDGERIGLIAAGLLALGLLALALGRRRRGQTV
jgi:ethanolamine utilization microcompartment shell protein EutS